MERITVYLLRPKDRPTYQLQWLDPDTHRRRTESADTADADAAERKRADKEYELNHGMADQASRMTWDRFRDLFESEYVAGLRERTQEKYGTVLDVFEQLCTPCTVGGVSERTLSLFVKAMRERKLSGGRIGLAAMTQRNYLVAMKTAMLWAVSQRLIPKLPTFPTVKVPKKKPQPIPAESFERLLTKAPDELWRAYLLCGWWGGLRLSECREMRWEHTDEWPWIDFEGNRIVLPAEFVKAAVDQWVPLHPVLRQALAALPRTSPLVFPFRSRKGGGRLSRPGVTKRISLMAKAAGVKLSMHRLRKGFGCRVAKQLGKGNAPLLHELMRHSSMQITMDYYASVDDVKQMAINELR